MSGLNGPHTQATGFNFSHSQLDSQPNYSFADLTQDGNGFSDFPEFSGLTQVSRSLLSWRLPCKCACHHDTASEQPQIESICIYRCFACCTLLHPIQCSNLIECNCCRTLLLKLHGMMLSKPLHWYVLTCVSKLASFFHSSPKVDLAVQQHRSYLTPLQATATLDGAEGASQRSGITSGMSEVSSRMQCGTALPSAQSHNQTICDCLQLNFEEGDDTHRKDLPHTLPIWACS